MFDRQRAYRQITRGVLGEYTTMKNQLITLPERIATENARLAELNTLLDMEATSQEADAPEKQPVNANEESPEYEP